MRHLSGKDHRCADGQALVEITGAETKLQNFILLMERFGISDLTRTGKVALSCSSR